MTQQIKYFVLALLTIALGLFSRSNLIDFPHWVTLYLGDFLWALMVFWLVCFLRPNANNKHLAIIALTFAFAIEFSQLYQGQWLNDIRHTRLGGLVLGFGFKWSDLIAYTFAVMLGAYLNPLINKTKTS